MRLPFRYLCLLISFAFAPFTVQAQPTNWTLVASNLTIQIEAATYGAGQFVLVGYGGTIFTSSNASNWTTRASGTSAWLTGVSFGSGYFVAAGGGSILVSSNAVDWQTVSSQSGVRWTAVAYGNGGFVVVGSALSFSAGSIARLTPPVTAGGGWDINVQASTLSRLSNVGFGNGVFVAGNNYDSGPVTYTSPDGDLWAQSSGGTSSESIYASNQTMSFGSGIFLFPVGDNGGYWSTNGTNWSATPLVAYHSGANAVLHDGQRFLWLKSKWLFASTNVVNWNLAHTFPDSSNLWSLAFGGGRYVAAGGGTVWTATTAPVLEIAQAVQLEFDPLVGVTYQLQGSSNMVQWTDIGLPFVGSTNRYMRTFKTAGTIVRYFRLTIP